MAVPVLRSRLNDLPAHLCVERLVCDVRDGLVTRRLRSGVDPTVLERVVFVARTPHEWGLFLTALHTYFPR